MFKKYIINNEIDVPELVWHQLISNYSQEEIIDCLSNEILSGNIRMPTRIITLNQMRDSFQKLLDYQCNGLQYNENVYTRYEYKYPLSGRYIDESNIGNIASDYFHQESRYACDSLNGPSPYRTWHSKKFLHSALQALFTLKSTKCDMNSLRTCLSLRKYVASQFKPSIAKSIYEIFNSEDVLDFSAGWGDRLCGFWAAKKTKSYVGIDPNSILHSGYAHQIAEYSLASNKKKTCHMLCKPAEEVRLNSDLFDTIFTSPPYFNIEKYCQEETQSFKRYRKFDKWLNDFLFRSIDNAWHSLKKGGYIIINISDVYSGHQINKICDPMNDYIKQLGGIDFEGLGIKMAKRPNSKAINNLKNGVFVEPLWVWRKP